MLNLFKRFQRGGCSILAVAFILSLFVLAVQPVQAGVIDSVKSAVDSARKWVINLGAIPAGIVMGLTGAAVLGIALGPIGIIAGGIGGYFLGKGLVKWIFSGEGKIAMGLCGIAGACIGGATMGIPGAILGGIIGAAVGKFLASGRLIAKSAEVTAEAQSIQDQKASAFISHMKKNGNQEALAVSSGESMASKPVLKVKNSLKSFKQKLYEKYQAAYKKYTQALQKGDQEEAKKSLTQYQKYHSEYQKSLGKEAK